MPVTLKYATSSIRRTPVREPSTRSWSICLFSLYRASSRGNILSARSLLVAWQCFDTHLEHAWNSHCSSQSFCGMLLWSALVSTIELGPVTHRWKFFVWRLSSFYPWISTSMNYARCTCRRLFGDRAVSRLVCILMLSLHNNKVGFHSSTVSSLRTILMVW